MAKSGSHIDHMPVLRHHHHDLHSPGLLAVDLITADGEFLRASATHKADLFWGVRGGGGNFGIVTEFEFRLHPLASEVFAGPIFWPMEDAANVLRFYRDWIAECPDELMTILVQKRARHSPRCPLNWLAGT